MDKMKSMVLERRFIFGSLLKANLSLVNCMASEEKLEMMEITVSDSSKVMITFMDMENEFIRE